MQDAKEMLRSAILSKQRGRDIDVEHLVTVLLPCVKTTNVGERTFVEEIFPPPSLVEQIERLNTNEKEVGLECLHYLMGELRDSISKHMN